MVPTSARKADVLTECFSRNIVKLFLELKLVPDNLPSINTKIVCQSVGLSNEALLSKTREKVSQGYFNKWDVFLK